MAENSGSRSVSLGCGTLILIAIIVLIFSKGGNEDVQREIGRLRNDVGQLQESVDRQTQLIEDLTVAGSGPKNAEADESRKPSGPDNTP